MLDAVLADLAAEGDALEALVADRPESDWHLATPATGWTVAHQIAHLTWTDEVALVAATDRPGFDAVMGQALADPDGLVDKGAESLAVLEPAELLGRWRSARLAVRHALAHVPAGEKIPWFGPPMSPASMATARIMETWAHGQDVADALGVSRAPTSRLRHVAHIGVRARDFSYVIRGLAAPADPFRVELAGPDGDLWTWGPDDAAQRVTGPALDFCLLVTQRANRADLDLAAVGPDADAWLDIAQAFAGAPGPGRPPAA